MFVWDFEVDAWSRFWRWNLIKICVWTCDTTSRSYFGEMNSTLGSVVPLAMFHFTAISLWWLFHITALPHWSPRPPPGLFKIFTSQLYWQQGCIFRLTCSHPELTEDHVLTSAYVKIFRTVTRNAVNKSVWRKKDCSWLPLNKHAMNIWLSSLRIRAHLSWRTGKHLHVLHVLRTYSTCSHPRW